MDRLTTRTKIVYALRGAIAIVVAVAAAVTMVLRGSGNLEQSTDIFVAVPATAGLISGEAPVRYHGVNVGRIGEIESGTAESVVQLQIQTDDASKIPADVVARVVPRTFFGDIYMQLVDSPNEQGQTTLSDGDEIHMDDGPRSRCALRRVHQIGRSPHRDATPRQTSNGSDRTRSSPGRKRSRDRSHDRQSQRGFRRTDTRRTPIPPIDTRIQVGRRPRWTVRPPTFSIPWQPPQPSRTTWSPTERISSPRSARPQSSPLTVDDFVGANNRNIITVIDSAGKILATTAANPGGLRSTLANASTFGAAGARVFATGKFDITAVATFAEPLPYTGDDCPQYGDSRGAQCSGSNLTPEQPVSAPVVGGVAEAAPLRYLEDQLLGGSPEPSDTPNPATTLMLGPMVRGNEVTVP